MKLSVFGDQYSVRGPRRAGCRPWRLHVAANVLLLAALVAANGAPPSAKDEPVGKLSDMKPTEVGIRFTPRMAEVIGKKITQEMKGRYELDDGQAEAIQQIIGVQMMDFANKNAQLGRDLFEMMTETMIENDGHFPKDAAQQFGKMIQPMLPAFREFFTETGAKVGQKLSVKQRLKFAGDMTAATSGLAIFESRMKRWQEGKVSDNANPFFDPADNNPGEQPDNEPVDPNETQEHRQARKNVERWIAWQIDLDKQWGGYVDRAIGYYSLNETQQTSAKAILEDCRKRAERLKTPEWRAKLMENRIAQQLSWSMGEEVSQGPFMYKLETEYETLRKPLLDIEKELKRRIEELPTTEQRAAAKESMLKKMSQKGIKQLPT